MDKIEKYVKLTSREALLTKLLQMQPFRVAVGKSKWVPYEGFREDYNLREILRNEVVIEFDTNQAFAQVDCNKVTVPLAWVAANFTCINLLEAGYNFEVWEHGGKSPHIHIRNLPVSYLDGDTLRQFKKLFIRKYVPKEYLSVVDYSLTGIHLIAIEHQFHWKGCYGYKTLLTSFGENEIQNQLKYGGNEMGTIAQEAQEYEPKTTKNIAELEIVNTDLDVQDREGSDSDGKPFSYKVIIVDGEEYRVPLTVLAALKDILNKKPDLKSFSVSKSGNGRETRYTVIPQV